MAEKDYTKTQVIIVGGGPAGLSAAVKLKCLTPEVEVCVIEKGGDLGNHNLSGAVLEREPLESLLNEAKPDWKESKQAKDILKYNVEKDNIMFMLGEKLAFDIHFAMKIAKKMKLPPGQMIHDNDYVVSVSKLTKWLGNIASELGVEVLTGFAAEDIILDKSRNKTVGVKLIDQGLDKESHKQPNYMPGEVIKADFVILAEGCDGLLTEKFIERANLQRNQHPLYSVGVKELIKVSPEQFQKFTSGRIVHAMGYPLWTPLKGPAMFGGGVIYPEEENHLAVAVIVGADWKFCDFNPQDALTRFKSHKWVEQFIDGGTVVESGAKMIPEAGYYGIPRDVLTNSIGRGNTVILGDSAGFVNMMKIKGLHNAIDSGIQAAKAIAETLKEPENLAVRYTEFIQESNIEKELKLARNFRQTIIKFGMLFGFPLSAFSHFMPEFKVERDYEAMTDKKYRLKPDQNFDKDTFTALAMTEHREEQPCHLEIMNRNTCSVKCRPHYDAPCITFCPAGVYETIQDVVKPANPSNCLHCKTCQRKCPFDNIRWSVPEGSGGPRYNRM